MKRCNCIEFWSWNELRLRRCRRSQSFSFSLSLFGHPVLQMAAGDTTVGNGPVGSATFGGPGAEERLEAEFKVGHAHDAVDGALTHFAGQREDLHGYDA
jgi:hypothetical protein